MILMEGPVHEAPVAIAMSVDLASIADPAVIAIAMNALLDLEVAIADPAAIVMAARLAPVAIADPALIATRP